jgi:hypothetical protein
MTRQGTRDSATRRVENCGFERPTKSTKNHTKCTESVHYVRNMIQYRLSTRSVARTLPFDPNRNRTPIQTVARGYESTRAQRLRNAAPPLGAVRVTRIPKRILRRRGGLGWSGQEKSARDQIPLPCRMWLQQPHQKLEVWGVRL